MVDKQDKSNSADVYVNMGDLTRLQHLAKGFSFFPKQPVNSVLSGNNSSKLRGRGLDFEELRHYQPGDDIRSMDWKVTKRTGKPYIRVYTEERERNIYLLIDQRTGMFFGSTHKMKSVVAAEIAALMAWRITYTGDRIGAIIFGENKTQVIPAKRGRQHVVHILSALVDINQQLQVGNPSTDASQSLNQVLAKLSPIVGHNAMAIIVSDGNGWNQQSTDFIKRIRAHNEVIACHISDPLEQQLPKMSQMVVSDGQMQIQFSSEKKKIHQQYQNQVEQQMGRFVETSRKYRIPLISINTIEPADLQLRKALGQVKP